MNGGARSLRPQILAFVCIALGAALVALPQRGGELLLHGAVTRAATARVDAAVERNQETFLTVSAALAAVAVVEGSNVGVGFDLQLGDVVQPVYDLVHFFWRLLLFSLLLLGGYKILMETGILGLGFTALGVALVCWGAGLLTPAWRRRLHGAARALALGGILFAYLVPLALLATHWLSTTYTRDLTDRYREEIAGFGRDLAAARDSVLDGEKTPPWYKPGERIEDFRDRLSSAAGYVVERFDQSLLAFTFYAILIVLDYLLLPFASAWLLYRLAALALGRLLAAAPTG